MTKIDVKTTTTLDKMLACVCQPAESRLYKGGGGGGVVTPLVHRVGTRGPGSGRPRPPKPAPKPKSPNSTSSEDTKPSPAHSSPKPLPKKQEDLNILSCLSLSPRHSPNKIKKEVIPTKKEDLRQTCVNKIDREIPRPHKNISEVENKIIRKCNKKDPFSRGNQEKLLKTKNDSNIKVPRKEESCRERTSSFETEPSITEGACNSLVTITDNDGKIYCVDNLILVGEDVFRKFHGDTGDEDLKGPPLPERISKLTVKSKAPGSSGESSLPNGVNSHELPCGVELTLGELRAMALRQQQQIDCQHQLLAAREQRLRFLKQQEARHHQVAAENERLRRLRERVEAQELKLRRLRALRGQLDQTNINSVALTSDLESIRALFNEKEKELSVAVAKVEELTRQLEEVRRGRGGAAPRAPPRPQPPAALELDKLRRELMYRNKLNEQQNARLSQQREALTARQAEMASIDQRISELQGRLQRKRVANRQLAAQITTKQHPARSGNPAPVQLSNYPNAGAGGGPLGKGQNPRGNIAAVEPYNHIPHAQSVSHNFQALKHNAAQNNLPMKLVNQSENIGNHINQQDGHYLQQKQFTNQLFTNGSYPQRLQANILQTETQFNQPYPGKQNEINTYPQGLANQLVPSDQKILLEHINKYNIDLQKTVNHNNNQNVNNVLVHNQQPANKQRPNEQEFLPEFAASKSDPKYQTLPYNTKFTTANGNSKPAKGQFYDENHKTTESTGIVKVSSSSNVNNMLSGGNLNHMTAHSTPLTISKGLATPLSSGDNNNTVYQQQNQSEGSGYHLQKSESSGKVNQEEKENRGGEQPKVVGEQFKVPGGGRAELVRAFSQHNTANATGQMKPVSSVAPTTVSGKPSPIYQTSSTKIQPVQPQTVSPSPPTPPTPANPPTTPHSSSTPLPEVSSHPKPALPPKPAPKLQSAPSESYPQGYYQSESALPPVPSSSPPGEQEAPSPSSQQSSDSQMIIKARPLTIRKQPLSEQPKLKSLSNNNVKSNTVNIATTRRIEMPPTFLFPEMEHAESNNKKLEQGKNADKANGNNKPVQHSNNSPSSCDVTDRAIPSESSETSSEDQSDKNMCVSGITEQMNTVDLSNANGDVVSRRVKKGNLKQSGKVNLSRRVSFDPLALLLDASLEGELELVKKTATQVANASAANDEGITALHNAICAGHFEIVKFLVEFGCDVNAQDSDGWTPLHCAASCNNVAMVRFLVENGACIFATTLSDHETAAQKCEEDEEGFDGCSEYLYSVQEKLGIMNGGTVYAVFPYGAHESDELSFSAGARLSVLRKGDDTEREWWWAQAQAQEGYVPRNLLGLYPRVTPKQQEQ